MAKKKKTTDFTVVVIGKPSAELINQARWALINECIRKEQGKCAKN